MRACVSGSGVDDGPSSGLYGINHNAPSNFQPVPNEGGLVDDLALRLLELCLATTMGLVTKTLGGRSTSISSNGKVRRPSIDSRKLVNTRLPGHSLPAIRNFPTCLASTPAFSRPRVKSNKNNGPYFPTCPTLQFVPLRPRAVSRGQTLAAAMTVVVNLLCMRRIRTLSRDRLFDVHQYVQSETPSHHSVRVCEHTPFPLEDCRRFSPISFPQCVILICRDLSTKCPPRPHPSPCYPLALSLSLARLNFHGRTDS